MFVECLIHYNVSLLRNVFKFFNYLFSSVRVTSAKFLLYYLIFYFITPWFAFQVYNGNFVRLTPCVTSHCAFQAKQKT